MIIQLRQNQKVNRQYQKKQIPLKSTLNKKEVVIEINYEEIPSEFTFEFTPLIITEKSIKYHNDNADSPMNLYNFSLAFHNFL
mgnify:CR=1 FL=1